MKKGFIIVFLFIAFFSKAQTDTIIKYFDKDWKAADPANATYKTKVFAADGKWHKLVLNSGDGKVRSKSVYSDKKLKKLIDTSFNYNSDESIEEDIYEKGRNIKQQLISPSNRIIRYAVFDKDGKITEQKGFDENGSEIPNYVYRQEAAFPYGPVGWQNYLIASLDSNVPKKRGAPKGQYAVTVSFLVSKLGNITEVKALNDPGYGMAEEAVRVIAGAPNWNPAIQYNKPVTYRQKQRIIFTVQ